MRQATLKDIATLVNLMAEFYAESGYELDCRVAEKASATLLADDRLGYVWIMDEPGKDVGYLVTVTAPHKQSIVALG